MDGLTGAFGRSSKGIPFDAVDGNDVHLLFLILGGDGTLLDHAMIAYGSGIHDGNAHNHEDLPIVLAGGGCGTLSRRESALQ